MEVKYPNITVKLVGTDGNAFAVMSRIFRALRSNNISENEIKLFMNEATAGDYDNLLRVCMMWVNVE